jgi:hypothetical protein
MKHLFHLSFIVFLGIAVTFTACKKDNDAPSENETNSQIALQADDEARVSSELDAVVADATILLEADPATSGDNLVLEDLICDASVVANTGTDPMTVTITYNGGNCSTARTRAGKVILSLAQGSRWKDAGASVKVEFQDFKITRKSDQKSITINGMKVYTNVSGGLMFQLATLNNITHKVTSDGLSIKFDDGASREWKVARQYVFTYNNGIVISISGLHTEGNLAGIVEWGTNRFGNTFTTSISSPLVIKQDCNFRVTAGTVTHATAAYSATATFGLNATGAVTVCPGTGKYYYKLEWNGANGRSINALIPY